MLFYLSDGLSGKFRGYRGLQAIFHEPGLTHYAY